MINGKLIRMNYESITWGRMDEWRYLEVKNDYTKAIHLWHIMKHWNEQYTYKNDNKFDNQKVDSFSVHF